jgi:hypothetical protein
MQLLNSFCQSLAARDKGLKTVQYLAKILVQNRQIHSNFSSFASNLSLARKIYRLLDWLPALLGLCKNYDCKQRAIDALFELLDAFSSFFDDACCLYRLKAFSNERIYEFCNLYSTRLWLVCTVWRIHLASQKTHKDTKLEKTANLLKLWCDLGFCLYEVFENEWSPMFPLWCGLASGALGLGKQLKLFDF